MNLKFRMGLRGKLLAPVLTALIVFMTVAAYVISGVLTRKAEETYVTMLSAGNEILVKNIRNAAAAYKSELRTIAINPSLRLLADVMKREKAAFDAAPDMYRAAVWGNVEELLVTLSDIFPDISQFNFALADGAVVASSRKATIGKVNVADREWFAQVMMGETVISKPLLSKSIGEKAIVVASPVHDSKGDVAGAVYAIIPCLRVVSDTIRNVRISETGYAYIVDGTSGLMIAHNVWDKIQTVDMFRWQPWMREVGHGDCGVRWDYVDSRGDRRLAAYRKEATSGWIAVSCIDMAEIEGRKSFIRWTIFAATAGGVLIVAFLAFLALRTATNDVLCLSGFAKAIAQGESVGLCADGKAIAGMGSRRKDELGDLGEAITSMVASLKSYVDREIRDTEARRKEFEAMRDSFMMTLASLVEDRDASTGQHIRKTSAYVKITTYKLREREDFKDALTDEFVDNIVRSAPLHDIGKINVPDAILNKPGRLTPEEFDVMKTHAAVGGKIISRIIEMTPHSDYLREAVNLATYHHERWDGAGYPEGLSGRAIPLFARIMAVADVFDALVSKRAYKDGMPLDKAFAIIREESGTHFDPVVVDAFFAAKREVIKVERHFERKGV